MRNCEKCHMEHVQQIRVLVNGIDIAFNFCPNSELTVFTRTDYLKIGAPKIAERSIVIRVAKGDKLMLANKFLCSVMLANGFKADGLHALVFQSEIVTGASIENSILGMDWLSSFRPYGTPPLSKSLFFAANACPTPDSPLVMVSNVEAEVARQFRHRSAHYNMNGHKCHKCSCAHPYEIELLVNGIELLFEVCIVAEYSFLCDNDFTKIRNAEIVEENVPFFGSNGETYVADKFICSVETNVSKRGKPSVLTGLVFYSEDITKSIIGIDWLTALNLTISFPSRPNDLIFSSKDCVTKEKRFPFWVFKYSLKATKNTSTSKGSAPNEMVGK
ncbi:hypothetical protein Ddc_01210 [Ditylenchus destructor]|nr:hypothetical protein Ddc_01210 [Ditylenchus destructor]